MPVIRLRPVVPGLVFLLAVLPFLSVLWAGFLNWDDDYHLLENAGFRGLGASQLQWMVTTTLGGHYHPLTWLSFGVNYALDGMNPWGYHLVNLLLHGANAVLFYFIARRLLAAGEGEPQAGLPWAAAFAALMFAVHPLRVESVAWLTERRGLLSALFYLAAVLAYLRGVTREKRADWRWLGLSLAAFAASLLSKAISMTLPAALLLLDVYPLGRVARLGWRRVLVEKVPFGAVAAAGAAVALLAMRSGGVLTPYGEYGPGARLAMSAYSFTFYPWKVILPAELSPVYELPARIDPSSVRFAIPLAVCLAVTVALVALRRRWPAGLAAWAYSVLTVLPVSGPVHSSYVLAADRYSYLSGLGFALLGGGAVSWLFSRRDALRPLLSRLMVVAAAAALLGLGAGSWRQSQLWKDTEALFRWAVSVDPTCAVCSNNLGGQLLLNYPVDLGRIQEAEAYFRRAIALRPALAAPYRNLGRALATQRRYGEAEVAYHAFLRAEPESPQGLAGLGMVYLAQERDAEAIPLLREARARGLDAPGARDGLGLALRRQADRMSRNGRGEEAGVLLREAESLGARRP
jgi:tetratricopeptide (TPR) repeat protein